MTGSTARGYRADAPGESTSLAPEAPRGARPWGRPWLHPDCCTGDHSGATARPARDARRMGGPGTRRSAGFQIRQNLQPPQARTVRLALMLAFGPAAPDAGVAGGSGNLAHLASLRASPRAGVEKKGCENPNRAHGRSREPCWGQLTADDGGRRPRQSTALDIAASSSSSQQDDRDSLREPSHEPSRPITRPNVYPVASAFCWLSVDDPSPVTFFDTTSIAFASAVDGTCE